MCFLKTRVWNHAIISHSLNACAQVAFAGARPIVRKTAKFYAVHVKPRNREVNPTCSEIDNSDAKKTITLIFWALDIDHLSKGLINLLSKVQDFTSIFQF